MGGIFISYRREDSGPYAGRLRDRLSQHFGAEQVFRDIDTINPGERFPRVIEQAVGSCDALLALIGPTWLSIKDNAGRRRLDNPDDFVRLEIATALGRPDVLVIPVLVGPTSMPAAADLPTPLAALAECNAVRITDENWDDQVARLTTELEKVVERRVEPSRRHLRRGRVLIAGIVAAALTAASTGVITGWIPGPWKHPGPPATQVAPAQPVAPTEQVARAEQVPVDIVVRPVRGDECTQNWMTPRPPQDLPPPPISTDTSAVGEDWSRWAEQVHAVPISSDVVLSVQGRTDAEVTIDKIEIKVQRAPAFAGTYAYTYCPATEAPVRKVSVDLDKDPPEVHAFDARDPLENGAPREIHFPYNLKVSKSEAETFFIVPYTDDCDCTWTGQVHWMSQGRTGSLPIDNNGAPFRITSSQIADHACQSDMGTGPWDCRPCSGPQESRCFA